MSDDERLKWEDMITVRFPGFELTLELGLPERRRRGRPPSMATSCAVMLMALEQQGVAREDLLRLRRECERQLKRRAGLSDPRSALKMACRAVRREIGDQRFVYPPQPGPVCVMEHSAPKREEAPCFRWTSMSLKAPT